MSAFLPLPDRRLTTDFAYDSVEAIDAFALPALHRDHSLGPSIAPSVASTTTREMRSKISRAEPCFITKRPSYALKGVRWINPVRSDDIERKIEVELFLQNLGVVRHDFELEDAANLTPLDPMLHTSLDKFGFFAVTCTAESLRKITEKVREENAEWVRLVNEGGDYSRGFYLNDPPFSDAQYEMVLLHPEHFLPCGTSLAFFSKPESESGSEPQHQVSSKHYVVGHDRTLREDPGTEGCLRLPPFSFDGVRSGRALNPFLVILNAEMHFRRFRRMKLPPLSPDVEKLIELTIELVDLIYWEAVSEPERFAYQLARAIEKRTGVPASERRARLAALDSAKANENETSESVRRSRTGGGEVRDPGENATLEERREHGQYLLSGRDNELDSDDEELLDEHGLGPDAQEESAVPDPTTIMGSAFLPLPDKRLTTDFAYDTVEAIDVFALPALHRVHSLGPSIAPRSPSTTTREMRSKISRAETCFITKRPSYALKGARWINPVKNDIPLKIEVELFLKNLGVVRNDFELEDTANLTPLDPMLHASLDKFGFFAVTCTVETLSKITEKVREENAEWLRLVNLGADYVRAFYLNDPPFSDAQYEMVLLHPEHFLPCGTSLAFFTKSEAGSEHQVSCKYYVVGHDRTLREAPGTEGCPRLPPFSFDGVRSGRALNPFLVILNAEINFRRFRRMELPPLSPDVEELINLTAELVKLIYWEPVSEPKWFAYQLAEAIEEHIRDFPADLPLVLEANKKSSIRRSRTGGGEVRNPGKNATLDERREYGQYLLSGRDNDLDSDDEELLEELALASDVQESTAPDPSEISNMVREWQNEVEVAPSQPLR